MGSYHLAIHEKLAAENEDIRIVAICDVEAHKLSGGGTAKVNLSGAGIASHYNDYRHYTDYDEMLRSESLDFVDIILPTYLHCDAAVKALEKAGRATPLRAPQATTWRRERTYSPIFLEKAGCSSRLDKSGCSS